MFSILVINWTILDFILLFYY